MSLPTPSPIALADRSKGLPLSFAQQRLWFLAQMEGVSEVYHIPLSLRLAGELDPDALRRALDRILARHEALRTTFVLIDGEPVQRIASVEDSRFLLLEHDLRNAQDRLLPLMAEEAGSSFDLERGPLIRGRLIRLADEDHVLLLTMHHIVSDGWSTGILINELSALYSAFREGAPDPLPALDIQYADYALWQRQWIEGEILQKQAEYWKKTLAGAPALLELPLDRPRPAQQSYTGAFVGMVLDHELTAGLRELSRRHGTTLFMTLLSAWAVLLARLSGQQDVVIGTPTANRGRAEIEGLIGFFVNTLALRVDLSSSPTVKELLSQVKAQTIAAQQHQDIPFEQVVEILRPVRSLAHSPLFQVMFLWQPASRNSLALSGLKQGYAEPPPNLTSKFDLTLWLHEAGDSIHGGLEYATSLFEPSTVERYLGYFRNLLEAMVADDTRAVDRLPLLPAAERHQVLYGWNDTKVEFPSDRCIHELFEEQVEKTPDAIAVVFEGQELSYAELNHRANQLAHHLRHLGVGPDSRVALCVERSFEMIVALLAVLKAGGAYVPLDPSYPADRLHFMLEDSAPVALLTQTHLQQLFPPLDASLPLINLEDSALWQSQPETNPDPDSIGLTPHHLAYIIYTSGSTGMPKGVMVQHQNVVNSTAARSLTYGTLGRFLLVSPISFDSSIAGIWGTLTNAGTLLIASSHMIHDLSSLNETIELLQVTSLLCTPSLYEITLANSAIKKQKNQLSRVIVAGEVCSLNLVTKSAQIQPQTTFFNEYGPTECTVWSSVHQCTSYATQQSIPIGRPISNTQIYILDVHRQPVPVGVAGELYIGGAGVARGYLNRPELTAEKFLTDPFSADPGARMYRTGDLGRWLPDGNIEFLGRNDFQVKIRGFRIELGEIEARLAEHSEVRDAVVVAREDTPGDKRLVAYYTATDTGPVEVEQLRSHLSAVLPDYMVPAAYVHLDALPLTLNGKLDRKALPAPEGDAYATVGYEPPQGETETILADIWADLLKLDQIGRHDNFFSLGGHSLLAVILIERMRRSGLQTDVRAIFATPTLAALAAATTSGAGAVDVPPNLIPQDCVEITPALVPLAKLTQSEIDAIVERVAGGAANVQDIYPLAPLQEGFLFHHLMHQQGDPYLLVTQFSFDSRTRLDKYISAMQSVIDRHDILRTAVFWEGLTEPVQVVLRRAILRVEEIKLDLQENDAVTHLRARFDPRRFRISVHQAPLVRVYIAKDEKNDCWLAMTLHHHLASDHSTLEVMRQEIEAHLLGQQDQLPVPFPFRNLVAQARLGVSQQEHEAFFQKMLGDVEEPTAPFDLLDIQRDGTDIAQSRLSLDIDLARRLRASARNLGVSVASLCHLAWAQVLAKTSGREDIVFGTVLFGRMQGGEGSDRVMGPFINTLPIRITTGSEGVEASVRKTHALLAGLMRHEHASLVLAQRCSSVPAPAPLFSALLNYRHSPGVDQPPSAETLRAWRGIRWLGSQEHNSYPLTLAIDDLGGGFDLLARVKESIDPMRICQYMETALASLAEALETMPEKPVRELEVLPAAERHQVLYGWNDTKVEFPSDKCIHELFEEQVEKTPDAIAVVFEGQELSYAELNHRANQLAHHLRHLGVGPDSRVALCVERSFEMIVALLAVLKAGGAYVPLDPSYPADRLHFMLEDSAPVALLTQTHLQQLFPPLDASLPLINLEDSALWQSQPETNPDPDSIGLTPHHLAYIIYTSGSTGMPKGVMVQHQGLCNYLRWSDKTYYQQAGFGSPAIHSISFDGLVTTLFGPILAGQTLTLLPQGTEIDSLSRLDLSRLPYTLIKLTPSHLKLFNQTLKSIRNKPFALTLMVGGEALVPSDILFWQHRFPHVRLINHFGPTEITVGCCAFEISTDVTAFDSIPIGRPISNTQIYILDVHRQPVPVGVAGELYIGGAGVARGYLNRPELTAEKFLTDPFSADPGARMYRTGDLGRWLPDGNIEFLGRNDFQVKIRGFRIELGEIEARLAEHSEVRDAVVVAREDTPGDKRLVAYYTATDTGPVEVEQLRSHLSAVLPDYMVPAAYVHLDALPLTLNGKLDRKALPAPEGDAYATVGYEPPQGETETILADIWADLLKLDQIGRHDNFFSLGGHSLIAVRVITKIRRAFSCDIAINDLFADPVLKDLARSLESTAYAELPRIALADRSKGLPLSFAQQRLWFLAQMEGVSEVYHIPLSLRLAGELDPDALRRALDRILARHEALRTTFVLIDGEPVQRIASVEDSRFLLLEHDLRNAQDRLLPLMAEEAGSSFDLERGPLIRGRLIRLADEDHVLLLTMHHIVSDGWSMEILINELSALYSAFREGAPDPLPALDIQYADYALWQRQWIEGEILQKQAEYWKKTLAGAPALLELPLDRPRPAQQSYTGAFVGMVLDHELTAGLRELSRRHGTTLFMTLLSAWAVLLARLSGQQDVVIGTPTANRGRAEIEGLIGFFVNTLALRVDLSSSPTVKELLSQVKAQTIAAQQHQDIPFEQVVEILRPVRSLAHSPLFQVMFAWQPASQDTLALSGLKQGYAEAPPNLTSKFDLTLSFHEAGDSIHGGLEYATSLFEPSTVERYLGYFRNLLEAMVADDTRAVDRLPLLPAAERHQVLYGWNDTKVEFPSDRCIHELFEEQVEKTPDAIAVVFEGQELSYAELNHRANQLAHHLRHLGVGPDSRVALCVERSFEMIVALLAVLKAGGAYVPLDPSYPADRLHFMLEDSAPVALLTQTHLQQLFPPLDASLPLINLEDSALWQSQPETNPDPDSIGLTPHHLAYIIYTSGSTGMPKGVMVQHQGVVNELRWSQSFYKLDFDDAVLQKTSFIFDASVSEFFWPFLAGCTLIVAAPEEQRNVAYLIYAIQLYKITTIRISPSILPLFLEQANSTSISSLRRVIAGGEELSKRLVEHFQEQIPQVGLYNHYGPTEASIHVAAYKCEHKLPRQLISIGRPISNTQIYILDVHRQPVPVGVAGELYIGGAGVARGYLNRPELTAEKFLTDPFSADPGARMYRTGDLGRWLPDGNIEFLGRNDFQVKIRGFRIELGEIEARLAEHSEVRDAVVVAREDTPGDKRLVAYYTATDTGPVEVEQLRSHLSAVLPDYMVPAAYVHLDALPLTLNGKLDRKALPAPEGDAYATVGYEPPQGETETILADIWADLLKLDQIGRHDNFFSLGGHSLLAVILIERMRRSGLQTDVRAIFATPTLAALAAATTSGAGAVDVPPNLIPQDCVEITPALVPLAKLTQSEIDAIVERVAGGAANVQDIYPLAPLQEGILFHHLMHQQGDPYLLATQFSFDSRTRLDKYISAMQSVIDRHDILRTSVQWEGLSEPVQVVLRRTVLPVEEITLSHTSGEDEAEQLYNLFDPRHYRIDVRQAPLLRVYIAEDKKNNRWLMLRHLHHLAGDHSTQEVMRQEIEAHLLGQQDQLPPPLPFRDLVAQARLGVSQQEHEDFFQKMLGDIDEPTAPFDLLDVQRDGTGVAQSRLWLDIDLARRLRASARNLGVSVASLCHLAWAQVLAKTSGREDIVFGTVLFGRMQGGEGSDRVMGPFINTLPIRITTGSEGVEASVRKTHALLAGLMRHEHASLVLAQRCSSVPAPAPLFSALLNYRHSPGVDQPPSAETIQAQQGMMWLRAEERTNYPFVLSVEDLGLNLALTAQVQSSIDPMRICRYMETALASLAEALETMPEKPVRELEVLPAAERHQVLYGWNDTKVEFPSDRCIHELFEEQVEKTPDAIAVVFEGQELSYAELNHRANQLAHHLRHLGVGPDSRVALCVERSFEMIVALLAVLKAGGAYVPLDPSYPADRLHFMLEDSAPVALLTQTHLQQLFPPLDASLPLINLEDSALWQSQPETNPDPDSIGLTPHHLAYIIYTSGSTGMPKGVMVQHQNVIRLFKSTYAWFQFDHNDVWTLFHSYAFDFSVWELWGAFLYGGQLVIVPRETIRSPEDFYALICQKKVTVLNQTPSAFRQLISAQMGSEESHHLRYVVFGGEALEVTALKPWYEQNPDQHTRLVNMYGITETTVHVTYYQLPQVYSEGHGGSLVGRPLPDLKIYILDAYGQPVPVGVAGELYIGGAGVARGYLNRPELTAEKFLTDPFSADPGARMYRTGDLGRWLPDGNIEFLGRNDFQVKIRGFRIELGEIEARLAEHSEVRDAVVVAREDTPGDKRLVAYYTATDTGPVEVEQLRSHLSAVLPDYMVPAAYVHLDALPLTLNGKLDRKALPAPEGDAYATVGYEPPQGETETILADIWADLLKLDQIGRHDNFFSLGGDSIRTIVVISRAKELGLIITLNQLFKYQTIKSLAAALTRTQDNGLPLAQTSITSFISSADQRLLPNEIEDAYDLTRLQMGMIFHNQLSPETGIYHDVFSYRMRIEDWNLELFEMVLASLTKKHPILRTSFSLDIYSKPLQLVHRSAKIPVTFFNIGEMNQAAQGQAIEEWIQLEKSTIFNINKAPLLRIFIHRRSRNIFQYTCSFHHAILDGWSVASFQAELFRAYRVKLDYKNKPIELLPLASTFKKAVGREQEALTSPSSTIFWKDFLAGHSNTLLPPPRIDNKRSSRRPFTLSVSPTLRKDLLQLAELLQVPLRTILLAAHVRIISLLAGQSDIVTGMVSHIRLEETDAEQALGLFLNTLPFRQNISPGSWKQLILATFTNELTIMPHRCYPYSQIFIENDCIPLFDTAFNYVNFHIYDEVKAIQGIEILDGSGFEATNFALTINASNRGDSLVINLSFDPNRFSLDQIQQFAGYYSSTLQTIATHPDADHQKCSLISAAERHQVLYGWNDTKVEFPSDRCIHELFEEQVEKTPDAIAVVFEGQELSYAELNHRANQLAHHLRHLGVGPDSRVALCVERSFEMIVAMLAVLKAGGAYVPLDPSYPADRLHFMLEDSAPVALLTQTHLQQLFPPLDASLPLINLEDSALWQSQPETNPDPDSIGLTPHHLAYIIYTSGSTGMPKGVMVQHQNVIRLFKSTYAWFQFDHNDVWTLFHSYAFDFSVWELWGAFLYGGQLVIVPRETIRSPEDFYALICQKKVTVLNQTPSAFRQLISAQMGSEESHHLRYVVFGGEALEVTALKPWYEQNPDQHTRLVNMYGITETTVHVTYYQLPQVYSEGHGGSLVGRPLPDLKIYILDAYGQPVPVGVAGELYIGGAGVARGYLNRPELTAEKFLTDPFSADPGARMYRTGDLGRWLPDGNIEFLGRNDFQVKIRGFRIELGEIEARLAEHSEVRDAVVVAREDTPGDKRLVAYYTATDTGPVEVEQLRSHLSAVLPDYMVPAAYVHLDALPLTLNGKLDRKALPAPEGDAYATVGYEPPQGETETILADIWADLLKLDQIGRHDNFFSLGGHSLIAVILIERMRRSGLQTDVRAIFATPTLAALAAATTSGAGAVDVPPNLIPQDCVEITPALVPLAKLTQSEIDAIVERVAGGAANVQDIYPLAPLQEGILFHHLMHQQGDPYLLATQFSFDSRTRLDKYISAMQSVIDRHDILRTSVQWEGLSEPVQVVLRRTVLPVEEITLSHTSGEDEAEQLYNLFDPRHYRIDVRQAPLLRVYIAEDKKNNRWLMLQLLHHIVDDNTSLRKMRQEIEAHLLGQQDQLPPPLPFRNLVAQARLGVSQQEHEDFFQKMLGDIDEPTAPFDLLDVQRDGTGVAQSRLWLDIDLARRLRASARNLGVSVASLCHLAWAQVLAKTSGREDIVFGTVLFGRMQGGEGSDRVMGPFINTLPIRITTGSEGVEASVRKTHALLAGLMRHEHASLVLAQRCSSVPAPAPLFSALLNYRHSPGVDQPPSAETIQAQQGMMWLRAEERTNYPFVLSVEDLGLNLALTAQVQSSIDPMRICRYMETALASLAEALETMPEKPVRELEVLPAAERHQVLYGWNDTKVEFPSDRCIHELFEEQVEKTPDAIAVVFEGQELSYAELNHRANQLAHHLRHLGVGPDSRVALCVERSFEMIVALLAVLKAGGAYVPLDPSYPADRLHFMLEDSAPVALLTQTHLQQLFPPLDASLPLINLEDSALWQSQPETNPDPDSIGLTPHHLAYIIYTSGSTGMPKGVMVQHQNVVKLVRNSNYIAFDSIQTFGQLSNIAFDASTFEIWGALLNGNRSAIIKKSDLLSPHNFLQQFQNSGSSTIFLTTALFNEYVQSYAKEFKRIKRILFGGEQYNIDIVSKAVKAEICQELIHVYGPTETTTFSAFFLVRLLDTSNTIPIGRPISNTQIYILDVHRQPVPVGVAGELYIGGAGVARGYLNRPELTAEKFLTDPFSADPGARMYRTGDLGRWLPDGNIEFLGRNDFQVKIRGFRIELGEIEARLAEHSEVRDAVVVAREDTPGDKRLVAYYTATDTGPVEVEQLRSHLSAVLPDYMVPAAYVHLDALPLTLNGKLDRKALPAPEGDAYATVGYEPPQGETETILADIWADLLKLDQIGRHDNFFSLGGHSLLAVRVITKIRRAFSCDIAINDLFADPVLKDLARKLVDMQLEQYDPQSLADAMKLLQSL